MLGAGPSHVNFANPFANPFIQGWFRLAVILDRRVAALPEEVSQQVTAFLGQDIPLAFEAMIEALVRRQELEDAAAGTALGIAGAVHDAGDAGVDQGAGAHGAGFEGDVEGGTGESVVAGALAGVAKGADLGVGAGVMGGDGAVPALAQNLARGYQHGPHRHLTHGRRPFGQGERVAHPVAIV